MVLGRKAEIQYLENYYARSENELVVLYGQKNVGKTTLIQQFGKDKECFYYLARPCSEKEQIYLLCNELKEDVPKNTVVEESYAGIISAMLSVKTEKRVIVIDEFQHIVKNSMSFMDELVKAVHNKWNNQPVMFILCSSSVYWIENAMVEKMGEAAYEISGLLKINELKFLDLVRKFKGHELFGCVETYAVLGGFPGFWEHFEDSKTVSENICVHILKKGSYFYEEGLRLLPEELREPSVYNTILLALASGRQKLNELYKHTGFNRAKISVYLKNLIELELVEKIDSYDTAGKENAQKGIYHISNRFVHFWYRYVFTHLSKLDSMSPEKFYHKYIEPSFKSYTAECFTTVCTEYLILMNHMNRLNFKFVQIGSWVGKVGTIDIVAQDDDGHTLIGCCNWEKNMMTYEDFEWLLFCAEQAKLTVDDYYLFTAGSFDEKLTLEAKVKDNIYLIDSTQL